MLVILGAVLFFLLLQNSSQNRDRTEEKLAKKIEAEIAEYEERHKKLKHCMDEAFAKYGHRYPGHLKFTLMTRGERSAYDASLSAQRDCQKRF